MDTFEQCSEINELLAAGKEVQARDQLIRLLDHCKSNQLALSPLVNHLLRESGLFAYLDDESSSWQDRFVIEAFKVNIGLETPVTLHREQSLVLKHLLEGTNLAISAPTSFGKSLIVDAFIAIRKPTNVLIIVPTIALTDETRRRLSKKFSESYKIVTTADVDLAEKNILIFPQERAIQYAKKLTQIDLLVVDEFYKASTDFDPDRSSSLLKAMLKLGDIANQKYYLAPNISKLNDNPFTKGMTFLPLDFNTVFLEKHELFREIKKDAARKADHLIQILEARQTKSLIYAGTYSNVEKLSNILLERTRETKSKLLALFSIWLAKNYHPNWVLTSLVKRGTGIHTGQLHRSLSQIQVRLFEEEDGLQNIVSTSSIIEGVNTYAENVIVWSNRNGSFKLKDFAYRNLIGRGGRMFKHFVGNIYILEEPPEPSEIQLNLSFPDDLLADVDEQQYKSELSKEQLAKIILYKEKMSAALGQDTFDRLRKDDLLISGDTTLLMEIATELSLNRGSWRGLASLNSSSTEYWGWILKKVLKLAPSEWEGPHAKFLNFVEVLSLNWQLPIPDLLDKLDGLDISIEEFFKLERIATYKLSALLSDINTLQKEILPDQQIDISPFISRLSRAFLPSCVFELEEYGLPRMLSKRLHLAGILDFENDNLRLHEALRSLSESKSLVLEKVTDWDQFDLYVLEYFFDGLSQKSG